MANTITIDGQTQTGALTFVPHAGHSSVNIGGASQGFATVAITTHAVPIKHAASPVGTVVSTAGPMIYDTPGNSYALQAVPGQILLNGVVVTSSKDVASLAMTATGVQQTTSSGAIWTVASTNAPGTYVGQAPSAPVTPPVTPTPPVVVTPVSGALNMWTPPGVATTPKFAIVDWSKLIDNITPQGNGNGLASKIPCPSGHLDYEYNNPELEYYCDPAESFTDPATGKSMVYNPFSILSDGAMNIHAETGSTPNQNQSVRSGCLSTAAFSGKVFAGGYGFYASIFKYDLLAGFWPAFWALSLDNNFTYGLELDALENWQSMVNQPHCGIANQNPGIGTFYSATMSEYTQISCNYQPDFVTYYANSTQVLQAPTPGNCLNKTIFWIWNVAVGTNGSWAGSPPYVPGTTMDMAIKSFAAF